MLRESKTTLKYNNFCLKQIHLFTIAISDAFKIYCPVIIMRLGHHHGLKLSYYTIDLFFQFPVILFHPSISDRRKYIDRIF